MTDRDNDIQKLMISPYRQVKSTTKDTHMDNECEKVANEEEEKEEDPFWSVAFLQQEPHPQQQYHELVATVEEVPRLPPNRVEVVGEEKFVNYQLPYILSSSSSCFYWTYSSNHDDDDDVCYVAATTPTTRTAAAAAAAETTSTVAYGETKTQPSNASVTLELAPLGITEDGIMGPVGGDAWYASALLTTMILQDFNNITKNKDFEDGADEQGDKDTTLLQPQLQLQKLFSRAQRRKLACGGDGGGTRSSSDDKSKNKSKSCFKVLELGSGAVALPGISCAVALETIRRMRQHQKMQQQQQVHKQQQNQTGCNDDKKGGGLFDDDKDDDFFPCWQVYLTDNDPDILEQLERNVQHNMSKILPPPFIPPHVDVDDEQNHKQQHSEQDNWNLKNESPVKVFHLDWDVLNDNDDDEDSDDDDNNNNKILDGVDLVIGSELVYTESTGRALLKILKLILRTNPNVVIWIVQVFDRYGWTEIVLPGLDNDSSVHIELYDTIPIDIHQVASTLIPMGGTLDRYAFGAVCIKNA